MPHSRETSGFVLSPWSSARSPACVWRNVACRIAYNTRMTTRYSGRIERYPSSQGSARGRSIKRSTSMGISSQKRAASDGRQADWPAETLRRLLDTHNFGYEGSQELGVGDRYSSVLCVAPERRLRDEKLRRQCRIDLDVLEHHRQPTHRGKAPRAGAPHAGPSRTRSPGTWPRTARRLRPPPRPAPASRCRGRCAAGARRRRSQP